MPQAVKVLLIEDNRIEAKQTQHWLSETKDVAFEVEIVDTLQAGSSRLELGGIDIVLLDLNLPDSRGLETFITLHERSPQVPIVVLTGEYDETVGPLAVEKGAQDYLVKQQASAVMLKRVVLHAMARHRVFLEGLKRTLPSKARQVIGFIGAKGGVGTTTTALNVALALSLQGKAVILVELRPSYGTLACHVHRSPKSNLRALLDLPPERILPHELDAALCQTQAGLRVLFGPQEAKEFKSIEAKQAEAIINGLLEMADFIVLDLPNQPSPANEAAVRKCNFVAVVTEREPASVEAGKATVAQLQSWGVGGGLVGAIVVTRTIYPVAIELSEIQSTMGCPIVAIVPWAATACLRALRDELPLVISQRENDAAINLADIAAKIATNRLAPLTL